MVRAATACARRSSAGSSRARTGRRSARCARAASRARTCPSTRRGTPSARACTWRAAGADRAPRRDRAATPRGDLLQAGPLLVAGGAVAYDPEADDEGFGRRAPVRPGSDRRPPPARGDRARRRAHLRRGVRRAVARRGRARAARAGAPDGRDRLRATRSTSTAAARQRWSPAAGCRTSRAAASRSPSRAGGRSRRRSSCGRLSLLAPGPGMVTAWSHLVHRPAGRHGTRLLPARRLGPRGAQPGAGAAAAPAGT